MTTKWQQINKWSTIQRERGKKIALGAVGEHYTQEAKNETTVKLTWHELKITSAIFSQMVNTAILCDPKRIVIFSF